jgi:hypothetical protein
VRQAAAASRPASARAPARSPADPVDVYREAANYGRVPRAALLGSLLGLDLSLALRAAGQEAPSALGYAGTLLMLVFIGGSVIGHYRGLYRVRRHHPDAWQPSARFVAGMLKAPFGIGNPRNTAYDRAVLWLSGALALGLLALLVVVRAGNR